jgi:hypothetical protein
MNLDAPNGLNSYFIDDAIPSIDDMCDIIVSVVAEEQFQRLCEASANWPSTLTNAQFLKACQDWSVISRNPPKAIAVARS